MKKQAFNPFLPGHEYIPDGEAYVFDGRVYLYGSHDRFDGPRYCMNDYVCWSAPVEDLANWRMEGVIYKKGKDPLDPEGRCNLFAPDMARGADGRYYLYYALNGRAAISVAVCDTPAGEFEFYGHIKRKDGSIIGSIDGDIFPFDPGVLIDDDSRIYLYSGFSPKGDEGKLRKDGCHVMELEPDMLTIKYEPKLILGGISHNQDPGFKGHEFFEAPSPRKINGSYYLVYSSINYHELCYAISNKPDTGYTYGGTIVSIGDVFLNGRKEEDALNYRGNTHGGLVKINNQWYITYHRHTNFHDVSRQACAEKVTFKQDGKIIQSEATSCGLNQGPLKGIGKYEARIACNLTYQGKVANHGPSKAGANKNPYFTQDGEDYEIAENDKGQGVATTGIGANTPSSGTLNSASHSTNPPKQYIANMHNGAMAGFKYFSFGDKDANSNKEITIKISIRAREDYTSGKMQVSIHPNSTPAVEIEVSTASLTSNWQTFEATTNALQGTHALYFTYKGEGSIDFLSFELEL